MPLASKRIPGPPAPTGETRRIAGASRPAMAPVRCTRIDERSAFEDKASGL